jgi:NAD-dependent SIR2 family protein deacetylase
VRRSATFEDGAPCRITAREDGAMLFEFGVAPEAVVEETNVVDVVDASSVAEEAVERVMTVVDEFVPANTARAPTQTQTPLSKMKKAELVSECVRCNIDATGTVAVLRARLAEHRSASAAVSNA